MVLNQHNAASPRGASRSSKFSRTPRRLTTSSDTESSYGFAYQNSYEGGFEYDTSQDGDFLPCMKAEDFECQRISSNREQMTNLVLGVIIGIICLVSIISYCYVHGRKGSKKKREEREKQKK